MRYRPEIDGLRAIAVVSVIFFHAGFTGFSGGFVGVDIFFVISGYLITNIILKDASSDEFSYFRFYERRARRILPALFAVITATIPLAWIYLLPSDMDAFGRSLLATILFLSNHHFLGELSYFDTEAELKPLLHTWSLAVEEQYYIIFPIMLLAFAKVANRRSELLIFILALISFFCAEIASRSAPDFAFMSLATRFWELAIGSLIAIRLAGTSIQQHSNLGSTMGLLLIFASVILLDSETRFPGLYAIPATLGTAMVIIYTSPSCWIYPIISNRIAVFIGLISYSAYLWHQPIFAYARYESVFGVQSHTYWILIAASFALATATWRFVETPFRNRAIVSSRALVITLLTLALALMGFGHFARASEGFQKRFEPLQKVFRGYEIDNKKLQRDSWSALRGRTGDRRYGVENNPSDQEAWFDASSSKLRMIIVGNSHAKDTYNSFHFNETLFSEFQFARYGVQL